MDQEAFDRKILAALDTDARASFQKIAKKLRISRQRLEYSIRKLSASGVIRGYYTEINFSMLGYWQYKVYCRLHNIDKKTEEEMVDFLAKRRSVLWVAKCTGRFDLTYSVAARTPGEFAEIQNGICEKFGKYIQHKDILVTERSLVFTKPFAEMEEKGEFAYGKIEKGWQADEKDNAILRYVATKGRATIPEIVSASGLSSDIVFYRYKKMKRDGVIGPVRADVDLHKLGYRFYKVLIGLNDHSTKMRARIESYSRARKNIPQYLKLLGDWDVELELIVSSTDELENEISDIRNAFGDAMRDYEIIEISKEMRLDYYPF